MLDAGVSSKIRESNHFVISASLVVLTVVAAIVVWQWDYFSNVIRGPVRMTKEQLSALQPFPSGPERFVVIEGDSVFDSGYSWVVKGERLDSNHVLMDSTVGYFQLLRMEDRLIVIFSPEMDTSLHPRGILSPLPEEIRKCILASFSMDGSEWLVPAMLSTRPYTRGAYLALGGLAPIALLALGGLTLGVRRLRDPSLHPLSRAAEAARLWRQEHGGTEFGDLAPTCDHCTRPTPVSTCTFRSSVSFIALHRITTVHGSYCRRCAAALFGRHTLLTLGATWWGLHGIVLGPVVLVQNIFNLAVALWQPVHRK